MNALQLMSHSGLTYPSVGPNTSREFDKLVWSYRIQTKLTIDAINDTVHWDEEKAAWAVIDVIENQKQMKELVEKMTAIDSNWKKYLAGHEVLEGEMAMRIRVN